MKKDRKDKYNNGFLISCVSCILMLLAVCYFGINATTIKGTAAATTTYSCASGLNKISHSSGEYCCPANYGSVESVNGTPYCVLSGYIIVGTELGDSACVTWSPTQLNTSIWQCEPTVNNVTFEDGYTCTAPNHACVANAVLANATTEYTVTYDGNGGTVKGKTTHPLNTGAGTITLLGDADASRASYTLLGWSTDKNASTATYGKGASYNVTGDVTLYAIWKQDVVEYTLTYDGNGGKVKGNDQFAFKAAAGNTTLLGDADTVWSGHTLLGWSTDKNASTATYGKGATYNVTGNVTLYAIWKVNTTSIAKPTKALCKSNLKYNGSTQVITTATSGTGFTLAGYNQKDAGTYSVTATLSSGYQWSDGSTGTASFQCTIAKATPVLSLNKSSLTIVEGQTDTFTEQATVAGDFANSSKNTNVATVSPASNTGVSANNIKTVTVTGLVAGTTSVTVVLTPTDTKNYTSASKTVAVTVVTAAGDDDEEEETSSTFTATFNPNGGTLSGVSSLSCTSTTNSCVVTGLPIATKSGYNFKGWGETSSCAVGNTTKLTLTGNKTYYACWEQIVEPPKDDDIENPQTGDFMIAIVAILGVASVAYLVYYYKKFEKNL